MVDAKVVRDFKQAFRVLLKEGKDPKPVMRVIKEITVSNDLISCLDFYCELFDPSKPPEKRGSLEFARSTGYALLLRAIALSGPVNLFAEMIVTFPALALAPEKEGGSKHVAYACRWAVLPPKDANDVIQRASRALAERRTEEASRRKILPVLLETYRRKVGTDPRTMDDLLRFDPGEPAKREEFAKLATACELAATVHTKLPKPKVAPSLEALDAAFKAFGAYLDRVIQRPLDLLCVLAWAREPRNDRTYWMETRNGRKQELKTPWASVWEELYLEAAWRGQKLGLKTWKIAGMVQAKTYFGDDAAFLLAPLNAHGRKLLSERLALSFRNAEQFLEINRGRRRATLAGRLKQLAILDEIECLALSAAVRAAWEAHPAEVTKRFTYSPHIQLRRDHKYWVNQSIQDAFTVLWVDMDKPPAERPAIVELHALPGFLFRGPPGALSDLHDEAFFRELARGAQALAAFMLAYLEVLGYAFDIMTAGMSGGLRHVIFEFAKERLVEELTNKGLELAGIDNPWVQALVGVGVNFVPKPKLGVRKSSEVLDAADAVAAGRAVDAPATGRSPLRSAIETPSGKPAMASRIAGPHRSPHDADNIIFLSPGSRDPAAIAVARQKFKDPSGERFNNAVQTQAERLGGWVDSAIASPSAAFDVVPTSGGAAALGGPGRPMARTGLDRGTDGGRPSTATRAIGNRTNPTPHVAEADRLRSSPLGKLLVEYDEFLEASFKVEKMAARNRILDELTRGDIKYAKAEARLRKLLNDAREHTGDYVAAGVIASNFTVKSVVSVPYRGTQSNVPILDQVVEIRHDKWDYLFNEVKGGEDTALSVVRERAFRFEGNTMKWSYASGYAKQASGSWYYHRIAEIYMKGDPASKALAKKMLKAARKGRVGFAVTKSGVALNPDLDFTSTKEVTRWFEESKWDTSGDFPIPKPGS